MPSRNGERYIETPCRETPPFPPSSSSLAHLSSLSPHLPSLSRHPLRAPLVPPSPLLASPHSHHISPALSLATPALPSTPPALPSSPPDLPSSPPLSPHLLRHPPISLARPPFVPKKHPSPPPRLTLILPSVLPSSSPLSYPHPPRVSLSSPSALRRSLPISPALSSFPPAPPHPLALPVISPRSPLMSRLPPLIPPPALLSSLFRLTLVLLLFTSHTPSDSFLLPPPLLARPASSLSPHLPSSPLISLRFPPMSPPSPLLPPQPCFPPNTVSFTAHPLPPPCLLSPLTRSTSLLPSTLRHPSLPSSFPSLTPHFSPSSHPSCSLPYIPNSFTAPPVDLFQPFSQQTPSPALGTLDANHPRERNQAAASISTIQTTSLPSLGNTTGRASSTARIRKPVRTQQQPPYQPSKSGSRLLATAYWQVTQFPQQTPSPLPQTASPAAPSSPPPIATTATTGRDRVITTGGASVTTRIKNLVRTQLQPPYQPSISVLHLVAEPYWQANQFPQRTPSPLPQTASPEAPSSPPPSPRLPPRQLTAALGGSG
ncbi:unnamed protein product [Closterium sp. NIES-65]|nr:unnamed protein product [Closterium sp. NIES-65]